MTSPNPAGPAADLPLDGDVLVCGSYGTEGRPGRTAAVGTGRWTDRLAAVRRKAFRPAWIALALTVALLGAWFVRSSGGPESSSSTSVARPGATASGPVDSNALAGVGSNSADPVARLEKRVADDPADWQSWAELGAEYVTAARIASDPSNYPRAEKAIARSLEINAGPENWEAVAADAALAAGRHDFRKALPLAEQAQRLRPNSSYVLAILVDSLTELGRYDDAVAAAQDMIDLKPNVASYARVSYQRELHGDDQGAFVAMSQAYAAAGSAADRAFGQYYLGEIEFHRGRYDAAAGHYRQTLRFDPRSGGATAGLGKVAAAKGDRKTAVARYEKAVGLFPDPELLKELGDLYTATGNGAKAAAAYAKSENSNARQAANGVDVNLEIALASADRKVDLDRGLKAAMDEWSLRQSIHVADALAWQLFTHGRFEEAL
ncbi:MAG: tetratricopeptide repeat protein, partial [Actinomycetota bacterium]